jgi:leucyl aminopeptidase
LFQISFAAKDIEFSDWHGDILAVAVTEKDVQPQVPDSTSFENAVLKKLDGQLGCLLRAAASEEEFTGKPGQSVVLRVQGQGFKRVALVGFVARSAGCLQGLGESVASLARAAQATSAAIFFAAPAVIRQELKLNAAAAIASGTVCNYYISPAVLFLSVLFAGLIHFLSVPFRLCLAPHGMQNAKY